MLADAGAPAVLAPAPLAVMPADAGAPVVPAGVPAAIITTSNIFLSIDCTARTLQKRFSLSCSHNAEPPQSCGFPPARAPGEAHRWQARLDCAFGLWPYDAAEKGAAGPKSC
jgi:hypothetical protein